MTLDLTLEEVEILDCPAAARRALELALVGSAAEYRIVIERARHDARERERAARARATADPR